MRAMRFTSRGPGLWWYILIGALCLLLAYFVLSKGHLLVETSTTINATPEQVWSVLSDTSAYPEWNPFIKELNGELAEGAQLKVTMQPPGGKEQSFTPTVTSAQPHKELRWLGKMGLPRFFEGGHYFVIDTEGQEQGTVKFVQGEDFRGVLVPFMAAKLRGQVKQGFEAMNEALKKRVETLYQPLLPGSVVDFVTAPSGSQLFRLQPSIIEGGAATDQGSYTSSIAYFTAPEDDSQTLSSIGDMLIEAGYNLELVDSEKPEQQTEYFANSDGSVEVHVGRFSVDQKMADMLAGVGKPVFPEGLPAGFLKDGKYQGYRIELREFGDTPGESSQPPLDESNDAMPDVSVEELSEGLGGGAPPPEFGPGG
jgi:hypothetical protein